MFQPKIIGQQKEQEQQLQLDILLTDFFALYQEKYKDVDVIDYCERKLTFLYQKPEEEIMSFLEQFNQDFLLLERELSLFFENKESMLDKHCLIETLTNFGKETIFDKLKNKLISKKNKPDKEFYESLLTKIQFLLTKNEKLLKQYTEFNKELALFLDISLFFHQKKMSKVNMTSKFWDNIEDKNRFYFILLNQSLVTQSQLSQLKINFEENIKQCNMIISIFLRPIKYQF
jgi:hypothetical protein